MPNTEFKVRVLSSLTKVFADEELQGKEWSQGSMLCNESYSFQVAYCWNGFMLHQVSANVVSEMAPWITLYKVGLVSCEMPCFADHDDNVLRTTPGLYPDPLFPVNGQDLTLLPGQWRSLWVSVCLDGTVQPGIYPVNILFRSQQGEVLGEASFQLEVLNARLPKQSLIHTEWFHADCLATEYGIEVFSEAHWERIGQYVKTAVEHGMNMILTPVFTPPLDTAVGGERPTVQLVDVKKSGDTYRFGFDKLERWVELCRMHGVEYFEISHLFTQWGAMHAPKIMAREDGMLKRIFGWETDAGGVEYKNFLAQFIPQLIHFLKKHGLEKCSYFHVSDEPNMDHFSQYQNVSSFLSEYLQDFPVMDALSDYKFYETGVVKHPIPATNHIDEFLENGVPGLWTYYCCGQYRQVSNRFIHMPSARNRILGVQLYKFSIQGFLHWGYNFWYSQHSRFSIDPYRVTDAGCAFPAGDPFVVYPGEEGPIASLRLKVFYEALQDLRALQLLEEQMGREAVLGMLEDGLETPISFTQYPTDVEWLLRKREQINRRLAESI